MPVVAVETSDGTEVAPRVSVEVRDGQATARATLAGAVAPHPGVSGVDGPELVATAVAAAADGGWSVIDVTAWAESGTHLAIVELARGPELAIGAAVATSANHAALLATARAAGVVGIHHRP